MGGEVHYDAEGRRRPGRIAASAALPTLSGRTSAWILLACLAVAATLLLPFARRLPFWLRAEAVLALWWAAWVVVLAWLLHRGARLSDDQAPPATARAWGRWKGKEKDPTSWGWFEWVPFPDPEGCLVVLAFFALLGLLWLLVEFAIPLLAFSAYVLVRGALVHVVHDRHGCRGRWGRSIAWAALWATLYVAPLAGLVALLHAVRSGGA